MENELERPHWFNINRQSPDYVVSYKDKQFTFTYHNTKIFIFPVEFEQFNHIYHEVSDEHGVYIFGAEDLMDDLHAYGWPMDYSPWPSELDVEAFIQSEMQEL